MARKTKARAVLDRQKAEEKPMIAKKVGDGKDKALKIKDGRVEKKSSKRPVSTKEKAARAAARRAIRTGETMSEDQRRRAEQDRRTLYIRFKDGEKLPKDLDEVRVVHKDIREVRAPRQAKKKNESTVSIRYAFIEFADEEEAEKAKEELTAKNFNVFVDYVGDKSSKKKPAPAAESAINPLRLVVSGVVSGLSEDKLKQLFPKCYEAQIPPRSVKKGGAFGFVEFPSVAMAKAAFDAAKGLKIDGNPATVRFAKMNIRRKRKADDEKGNDDPAVKVKKTPTKQSKIKDEDEEDEEDGDEEEEAAEESGTDSDADVEKGGEAEGEGEEESEDGGDVENDDDSDDNGDVENDDNVENNDNDDNDGDDDEGEEEGEGEGEGSDSNVSNDEESEDDE